MRGREAQGPVEPRPDWTHINQRTRMQQRKKPRPGAGDRMTIKGPTIKGLHHNAYRCRDSEETRAFYEDFLGLPLADAFEIRETKTGRETCALHSFYQLGDGSFLAFFEVPDSPFDFKDQHDYDLHIALEVDAATQKAMFDKGKAAGIETRGVADHGFIHSIYFRDPNGYVIELTAPVGDGETYAEEARSTAHDKLARWQESKSS